MSDNRPVLKHLKWWDIMLLTFMIMGYTVIWSVSGFIFRSFNIENDSYIHKLFSDINIAVVTKAFLFGFALFYLYMRHYDFSNIKLSFTPEVLFVSFFLFLAAALIMDVYLLACHTAVGFFHISDILGQGIDSMLAAKPLPEFKIPSFIYAIFCGFTEEIFYLGICLSVSEDRMISAFIYTQIIRFFSHTHQGVLYALGIAVIWGTIFYYFYQKVSKRNLLPFCIAHVISSIIGHGILSYLSCL